jgi:dipeptidyl aminopeptidase/acylaminoacyl peptidase
LRFYSRPVVTLAAVLSAALFASLAGPTHGSERAYPGENGLIAYDVTRVLPGREAYDSDICLLDPSSGETGRLTRSLEYEFGPAWSPDGSRVAYSAYFPGEDLQTSVVYVRDLSSGRRRNVTGPRAIRDGLAGSGVSPTWLPRGKEIGFGWGSALQVVGVDSRRRREVWQTQGFPIFVSWSPNGRRVAFIAITDPSGTGPTSMLDLSTRAAKDIDPQATAVDWSPDGDRLAQSKNGIRIIDPDGRELHRITSAREAFSPRWSPDARWIVFERRGDLFAVAVDGSGERRLTRTPGIREGSPDWQPSPARRRPRPSFRTPCTLLGTDRGETLRGTSGADFAEARRGNDLLLLGRGHDVGKGGEGRDRIYGGPGNDLLGGGPGPARDVIFCGSGRDVAIAGRRDSVARDCERVRR